MKISFFRSLKHDYAMLGAAIFSVFALIINIYIIVRPVEEYGVINGITYILMVFLLLMIIRFYFISMYYKDGIEVLGVVQDIWFHKDRGRVTYAYEIEGTLYRKGSAIMKTKETKMLSTGTAVRLMIKKKNPKKAIIAYLYSKI